MSLRTKGLLLSPFVLYLFMSCVTAPEKPAESLPGGPAEKPAEENPLSFYRGPGDAAEAIRVLEERQNGEMDRDSRFIYYSLLVSHNDMEKACEQLEILLKENPDDMEILSAYITMMDYMGEDDIRDKSLDKLISLDGSNSFALNMKGSLALRKKDYNQAEKLFLKSLAADGNNSETYIGLANALMHIKGREQESIGVFDKAQKLDPENPFIYSDRSRVQRFLKDYGKAEDDMTAAIALDPSEWNYLDRARIRIGDLGDVNGAKEDLLEVLKLDRENFFANVYLAGIFDEEADYVEARIHYEKVIELADDYKYAYPSLGKIYFIEGEWEKSAEMYKKASESNLYEKTYPLMAWLAYGKSGKMKEGNAVLNASLGQLDRSSSIYEMYRYYLSPGSPYFVQMAVDNEKDDTMRDRMKYYLAMMDSIEGHKETAKALFGEIAERKGAYEFELAALEMENK